MSEYSEVVECFEKGWYITISHLSTDVTKSAELSKRSVKLVLEAERAFLPLWWDVAYPQEKECIK